MLFSYVKPVMMMMIPKTVRLIISLLDSSSGRWHGAAVNWWNSRRDKSDRYQCSSETLAYHRSKFIFFDNKHVSQM